MQPMSSRILWLVAGVFLASLAMSPVVLIARNAAPMQPSTVATVNLEMVFNSLNQKNAADADLQKYADEMQGEQDKKREEIQRIEEELAGLAPNSQAYQDKFAQWKRESLNFQALTELHRLRLDKKKGFTLRAIYLNIKGEVAAMSNELGIDIVLLDDAVVDLELGAEADVARQISARRTLYCNPAVDVTADLIDRMNRKFKQP